MDEVEVDMDCYSSGIVADLNVDHKKFIVLANTE